MYEFTSRRHISRGDANFSQGQFADLGDRTRLPKKSDDRIVTHTASFFFCTQQCYVQLYSVTLNGAGTHMYMQMQIRFNKLQDPVIAFSGL